MGGRDRVVTDAELMDAVAADPKPVAGTMDVAQRVDMTRNGAESRLKELANEGKVKTAIVGNSRIWWIPDDN